MTGVLKAPEYRGSVIYMSNNLGCTVTEYIFLRTSAKNVGYVTPTDWITKSQRMRVMIQGVDNLSMQVAYMR